MYTKWNEKSLSKYDDKVEALLNDFESHWEDCKVHIGTANSKTRMCNEGTSAGIKGTCSMACKGDCREGCYAIVHGDGIYTSARRNHAENTIYRRHNKIDYYETFFTYANKHEKNLRVNETGDFECKNDIIALIETAQKYPNVRVIGYTKRVELLDYVAKANALDNVTIHYSLACNGGGKEDAEKHNVPFTAITFDKTKCNCPFQVAKMNGNKVEWSCDKCAENRCGCFSKKDIYFLAH